MLSNVVYASSLLSALVAAAPAPQVPGYTGAAASFPVSQPTGPLATSFGPDSQIPATPTRPVTLPPRKSPNPTGPTSHGPFTGTPTTTGALRANTTLAQTIAPQPPSPAQTYFNPQGVLLNPAPVPYMPAGGLGTNGTQPVYQVNSDFDFHSLSLGLYHEYIELDLFNNGLAVFSEQDFIEAGLTAEDRAYIAFMAIQETGHATVISNMLGPAAPVQCTYDYPFRTVREFIDFNQKLTSWSEASVFGFLEHLDSRAAAQLLLQTISVESRQQMSFRQMLGLHPMPVWHEASIPQSWAWSYLAPYISSCPANQTRLPWQNFPALFIVNQPNPNRISPNDTRPREVTGRRVADPSDSTIPNNASCVNLNVTGYSCGPAITRNRTEPLSFPGRLVNMTWEAPGMAVGPNNSYITNSTAGAPRFAAWVSQLNLTYTPLQVTGNNTGFTYQPADVVWEGDPAVNSTMFVALTDANPFLTPFNLTLINPHVVALGLYQAG
ncbi:uncharacterized protein EI97DRAFT_387179 [Westerdykella ornata]|uniref:Stress response protein Rds1 n=1 Tax=Westerdykella ornata TaxID=318751 RepID=A0A6A6J6R3_WESOR|nr:uncharacterized protein EI97DRAFT_387179 [Westerdykella ornata]KAF2271833.1 hypothetical protein EI97DRAFT_387179 [Westerdykella ornata]